jgi:hypothetical protein
MNQVPGAAPAKEFWRLELGFSSEFLFSADLGGFRTKKSDMRLD